MTRPGSALVAIALTLVLPAIARAQDSLDPAKDGPLATASVRVPFKGVKGENSYLDVRLPKDANGPLPVIVISPGWAATTTNFEALADHLASRGFAVALLEQPHNWSSDMEEWSQEIRRGIDQLAASNGAGGALAGRLDMDHLGVVGHSYGGAAVVTAAAEDPRIKAVVALAPVNQWHKDALMTHASELKVPLLVEAGGSDWLAGRDFTKGVYDHATASPDRQFIQVKGGGHNLYQDGDKSSQEWATATRYTTAWLETFVAGKADPNGYTNGTAAAADEQAKKLSDDAHAAIPVVETPGFVGPLGELGK